VACVFNIASVSVCPPQVACVLEDKQKHWQY
jgi:hypothetical protein